MIEIIELWKKEHDDYNFLLKDGYKKYIEQISVDYMAASLECCKFLLAIYDFTKAHNILDLGSGFSSYTLRLFKKIRMFDSNIISVDTSEEWLSKTSNFCVENNVDGNNFITWEQFKDQETKFDLIFLDIDYTKNRPKYYNLVFENFSTKGTFVLCDDMHKKDLSAPLNKYLENKNNLKKYDVKPQTLDKFKRFSVLVEVG
jgi:predicted O-methyltransferase YrrM